MTLTTTLLCSLLTFTFVTAQAPPRPRPARPPAAAAAKFKAIWEPVPFGKDLGLNAVTCVGPEACFAVGDKSTILFTSDGGTTWQVQLGGDPGSIDDDLSKVFFLDAKNGWAMTERGKILGTHDGSTWEELATESGTTKGVWFLTPQNGVEFENSDSTTQSTMKRSMDGGKSWKPEGRCSVDATVGGLARKLDCRLFTAHFLSPTVGFVGGGAALDMGTSAAAFGRTNDGAQTWAMSVIPESKRHITGVTFWTERDGIAVLEGGEEVHWTADGGATWTRAVRQRLWPTVYGVGEGKIIVEIKDGGGIAYSFNGGRNFTSRPFTLPARPHGLTFPDAQHGYVVGQHGMVYRYRIVPMEYTRQGMLAALAP